MKPHKWAKEIKAWADGAEIETQLPNGQWEVVHESHHLFDNQYEYRIKPQPKEPQYLYVYRDCPMLLSLNFNESYKDNYIGKIKLEDE